MPFAINSFMAFLAKDPVICIPTTRESDERPITQPDPTAPSYNQKSEPNTHAQTVGQHGWSHQLELGNLRQHLVVCSLVEQDHVVHLLLLLSLAPLLRTRNPHPVQNTLSGLAQRRTPKKQNPTPNEAHTKATLPSSSACHRRRSWRAWPQRAPLSSWEPGGKTQPANQLITENRSADRNGVAQRNGGESAYHGARWRWRGRRGGRRARGEKEGPDAGNPNEAPGHGPNPARTDGRMADR